MVVAECTPFTKRLRKPICCGNDHIVCTVNSFTSCEMKQYDAANGDDYDSEKRYQTVIDSFQKHIKGDIVETTQQLLKGEYGFMCQYDYDPHFETVWSSVFDLESLMIYRAEGDPRRKKYIEDARLHDIIFHI